MVSRSQSDGWAPGSLRAADAGADVLGLRTQADRCAPGPWLVSGGHLPPAGPLHQVARAALAQGVEEVWLLSPADGRLVVLSATGPPR